MVNGNSTLVQISFLKNKVRKLMHIFPKFSGIFISNCDEIRNVYFTHVQLIGGIYFCIKRIGPTLYEV